MTTHENYTLNKEVTTATPSLKKAALLGVKVATNLNVDTGTVKKAILVASFGTTYPATRASSIDSVVEAIRKAYPQVEVRLAFTSHMVISRIKKQEGITYPTPEEALTALHKEGYTHVAIATLDCIPGLEYDYKVEVFHQYAPYFQSLTLGLPLMYWMGQEEKRDDVRQLMEAVLRPLPPRKKDQAVLLMAHGTPHPANAYYAVIQDRLEEMGADHTYIYSVEGSPHLEDVIKKLKAASIKDLLLLPLMIVAGDHARNDMAGEEDDSHKSILEKEGFTVSVYLKGMGENEYVRALLLDRANEAWQALSI